ncbi:MAG: Rpn family recombination-promoting nuclease/putative transposase [Caldilineaceae bacterium SB0665_bin_21]|nr:Rpn family recombination-promoting nuclease/putative transposase [Caldilineaceae bacterium SB0665_bin_21]
MSQPSEPTLPPFSHDLTAKSIFAEPEAARDLVALLAARECPELWGWTPVRLVAGSAVTADPERYPSQAEGHRDLVWELALGDHDADRMLLHLEFQSQRDANMSERMFLYALRMSPSLRGLEVCGVVVNTGVDRFGEWRSPVQAVAGVRRYGFRTGALLEIHDHAVPGLEGGAHALPPDNLAAGFVALARVQAEMARGQRAAVALVLPVLRELVLPRALGTAPSLRRALGAWFKTRFDRLLADQPDLRAALRRITYIEEAEAVMYTFGQYVEDEKKDAEARGMAEGEARGKKEILLAFIRQVWGDAEADRCARELDAAALDDLPDIAGLLADQAAGRRPRLGPNGRTETSA